MKTLSIGAVVLFLTSFSVSLRATASDASPEQAPGVPATPEPTNEHAWLRQFVGEWESEADLMTAPGQAPVVCRGMQTARMVGGFWLIEEGKGDFPCMGTVTTVLTIG